MTSGVGRNATATAAPPPAVPPPTDGGAGSGLTVRSFAVGAALSAVVCIGALHSTFISASFMALNVSVPMAVFVFFLFIPLVNTPLGWCSARLSLSRRELLTVYVMLMTAATVPTEGFVEHLIPKLVSGFYYASPENGWADLIHPYIPTWMAPRDPEVVRHFFEGLPAGASVPWGAWAGPLLAWSGFFLLLCFVMVCCIVVLRRQWVDSERLAFPLVRLPLEMVGPAGGAARTAFFRSLSMWLGFLVPFCLLSCQALSSYYSFIPVPPLSTSVDFLQGTVRVPLAISFMTLGFSFFVNLQVLLSIWACFLLVTLQSVVLGALGIEMEGQLTGYASADAIPAHEGMGALFALVIIGLVMARRHLAAVLRTAAGLPGGADDSGEILSYRAAVLGLLAGGGGLLGWLVLSGMPLGVGIWFLVVAFVLLVGLTRFVAEAGLATIRAPIYPQPFLVSSIGTSALGMEGLVALGMTYGWIVKVRLFVMATCANTLKLQEEIVPSGSRRGLLWAMALAVVVSLVVSMWFLLRQAYAFGGINLNQYFFSFTAQATFLDVASWLRNPTGVSWQGWLYVGFGAAVTGLVMTARHFLVWWPVHPIGFPIATTWMAAQIWWSVFLVWMLKTLLLKYGGPRVFRSVQPFFLGMILGNVAAGGFWMVVDGLTGMEGNMLVYF